MADAVLSTAVDRIFALLQEQAVYHVNLVRGAEKEVREFGEQLNTIRDVLVDAENQRFKEKSIKTWLWKLRHTSYEMEDILDEWKYALLKLQKGEHPTHHDDDDAAPPKQKVCSFIPSSSCFWFKKVVAHHDIAKKVLNVKARFNEIIEESKRFGFSIYAQTDYPEFRRDQTTSFINIEEVHGRDADGDTLVDKLMGNGGSQETSGFRVVSIVGVGGLGKTTLAQLVYNHSRVKQSFKSRIWICVSQPFDRATIAKGILEKIQKGSSQGADQLDVLVGRVRDFVKENKFFLVLDDVWSEDSGDWEFLEDFLKLGGAGSKVLVTTRSKMVAMNMGTKESDMYEPRVLSDNDCWLILHCKSALFVDDKAILEETGKKIAKKCRGLPLAATTLGGILRFKRSLREWENVLNDKIWEMQGVEDMLFRPLLMSYKELSPTEKQCFSYCAAFPKDFVINIESVIGNWMALGYLGCNSDDMEKKGKECFEVLAMRSLFQNFWKGDTSMGETSSCKMHDIVHEFATYLRMSSMKKAEAEVNKSTPSQTSDPMQVQNANEFCTLYYDRDSRPNLFDCVRLRVLSLAYYGLHGVPPGIDKLIHLRWLDLSKNKLSTEDLKIIFHLYFLQTLNLSKCSLEEISNEIQNLSHLRHLNLSNNCLKELPSEIGNLEQLRHLNLFCNKLKELPSEIGKLSFLQTIILPGMDIQIPEALSQLTSLQIFVGFCDRSSGSKLGLLKNLNQLVSVTVLIKLDGKDLKGLIECAREANFSNKKYIEGLTLFFEDEMGEEESSRMDLIEALKPHPNLRILSLSMYKGSRFPLWIVSPANQLRKVMLSRCDVTSLPSLGKLQCLEEIFIGSMDALEFVGREFLGITTNTNFVAFPKLKKMTLENCEKWEKWEDITAEEEESPALQVMPCLRDLTIDRCVNLIALPHRIMRKASSLETLDIFWSDLLEQRYKKKESSDWKSISLNNPRLQLIGRCRDN